MDRARRRHHGRSRAIGALSGRTGTQPGTADRAGPGRRATAWPRRGTAAGVVPRPVIRRTVGDQGGLHEHAAAGRQDPGLHRAEKRAAGGIGHQPGAGGRPDDDDATGNLDHAEQCAGRPHAGARRVLAVPRPADRSDGHARHRVLHRRHLLGARHHRQHAERHGAARHRHRARHAGRRRGRRRRGDVLPAAARRAAARRRRGVAS